MSSGVSIYSGSQTIAFAEAKPQVETHVLAHLKPNAGKSPRISIPLNDLCDSFSSLFAMTRSIKHDLSFDSFMASLGSEIGNFLNIPENQTYLGSYATAPIIVVNNGAKKNDKIVLICENRHVGLTFSEENGSFKIQKSDTLARISDLSPYCGVIKFEETKSSNSWSFCGNLTAILMLAVPIGGIAASHFGWTTDDAHEATLAGVNYLSENSMSLGTGLLSTTSTAWAALPESKAVMEWMGNLSKFW